MIHSFHRTYSYILIKFTESLFIDSLYNMIWQEIVSKGSYQKGCVKIEYIV